MQKLTNWFKQHFGIVATCLLLAFIPLYPKFPLLDLKNTWVYIRLEDFLVASILGIFLWLVLGGKMKVKNPFTRPITGYLGVGLLVLLVSILFTRSQIPHFDLKLAILHYLRRWEYILPFFLAYEAIYKRPKNLRLVIGILSFTALAIFAYGLGQKFLGWPAYLTMNEEFAKGLPLRLPPTARIPSTFGGHYDLAAYLIFLIPIFGSLIIASSQIWLKVFFLVITFMLYVLLLFTASRVSFGVYLIGISAMLWWQHKRWLIIPVIILSIVAMNYISGTSERFLKTLRFSDVIIDLSTGRAVGTLDKLQGTVATLEKEATPAEESLPTGSGFVSVSAAPVKPTKIIKTVELFKSQDLASGSGEVATISGSFLIQKALVYDISITTRFQGQWPKAIEAFKRNILFGSGFSSLSLAADGDYHRMLGETGLIGTIAFLGIFLYAFVIFFQNITRLTAWPKAFVIGTFAGLTALLFNAVLIDVFEASKVAYSFWLVFGVAIALLTAENKKFPNYLSVLKRALFSRLAIFAYLLIPIFVLYGNVFNQYFLGDDFTWLKWAAGDNLLQIHEYFSKASGFFYRPIPKYWYFLLFSIFWLKPAAYHLCSLLLYSGIILFMYFLLLRIGIRRSLSWFSCLLFGVLAVHHENIYWISSQSSLLATFFFLGALLLYDYHWSKRLRFPLFRELAGILLIFLSLLSYEGFILAPIIISLWGLAIRRQKIYRVILPICTIPIYWLLRNYSGAVTFGGDYNYRLITLPLNYLVNSFTYFVGTFTGPNFLESLQRLREVLRGQKTLFSYLSVMVLLGLLIITWFKRKQIFRQTRLILWLICGILMLIPYLGLGGVTSRYAFGASIFFIFFFADLSEKLLQEKRINKYLVFGLFVVLIMFNWKATKKVGLDWQKAAGVTEQTLLTIKKQFFPLTSGRTFVFINVPIRLGQAWIFPTGLNDALWHLYRSAPYAVAIYNNQQEAHKIITPLGFPPEFLIFEDYKLKKSYMEIQTFEEEVK